MTYRQTNKNRPIVRKDGQKSVTHRHSGYLQMQNKSVCEEAGSGLIFSKFSLLDRLLIVQTKPYSSSELQEILRIRFDWFPRVIACFLVWLVVSFSFCPHPSHPITSIPSIPSVPSVHRRKLHCFSLFLLCTIKVNYDYDTDNSCVMNLSC